MKKLAALLILCAASCFAQTSGTNVSTITTNSDSSLPGFAVTTGVGSPCTNYNAQYKNNLNGHVIACVNPNPISVTNVGAWQVINTGTGGASSWGSITGTLGSQSDLQAALAAKQDALAAPSTISGLWPAGSGALCRDNTTGSCGISAGATYTAGNGLSLVSNTFSLSTPTASTLGGVKSGTASAGQHVSGVDTSGNLTFSADTGAGSSAFSAITGGTNTSAAMLISGSATLAPVSGGTITANSLSGVASSALSDASSLVTLAGVQTLTNKSISAAQVNSGTFAAAQMPALTGDVTNTAGSLSTTVGKLLGNTIPANATGCLSNNGSGTLSWAACSGGSSNFSAITSSTNTSAAMLVGSGASLAPTGTGTISANQVLGNTVPANASGCLSNNGSGTLSWAACSGGSGAFSGLTGGTNTSAALVVGSGASLSATGSGTIAATTATSATTATTATTSTNLASGAIGSVPYQTGAGATAFLAGNTAATDQVFVSHGSGSAALAPTLSNAPALNAANMTGFPTFNQSTTGNAATATSATTATNVAGGAVGSIHYQSAANTTSFLAGNTAATDQVLVSHGTGSAATAPTLSNAPAISAGNMTGFPTLNQNTTGNAATATSASQILGNAVPANAAGCLSNNGSGTLSWAGCSGSTYSAGNGLSLTSNTFSLAAPTASVLGGVKSGTASAGSHVSGIDTSGNLTFSADTGGAATIPAGTTANANTGTASGQGSLYYANDASSNQLPYYVRTSTGASPTPLLTTGPSTFLSITGGNTIDINTSAVTSAAPVIGTCTLTYTTGFLTSFTNTNAGNPCIVAGSSVVNIQSAGSSLGTAGTINFGTGTSVSVSGGVATVTASGSGSSYPSLTADGSGNITITGTSSSSTQLNLYNSNAANDFTHVHNYRLAPDAQGGLFLTDETAGAGVAYFNPTDRTLIAFGALQIGSTPASSSACNSNTRVKIRVVRDDSSAGDSIQACVNQAGGAGYGWIHLYN